MSVTKHLDQSFLIHASLRRLMPKSIIFLKFYLCWIAIFPPVKAWAWAWEGHEIVAYIAEENLTLDAASQIKQLLASEGKSSLTEISSWADYVRPLTNPPQPLHSVRIPLDHTPYDSSLVCKENRCVVGAIEDDISLLKSKRRLRPIGSAGF